jgi:hypothetical protein
MSGGLNMVVLHFFLFIASMIGSFYLYIFFSKAKKLFDDRFSMTVVVVVSSAMSLLIGFQVVILVKVFIVIMMIIAVIIGVVIGIMFGSYSKSQFIFLGMFQGFTASLMGAMAGVVLLNPSLCGLPWDSVQIEENVLVFHLFLVAMVAITMSLLIYSYRV